LLCIAPAATRATGKQTTINKYTNKAGRFDGHGNVPVCNCVHCLMEEVHSFTRSHWTPPLGKYHVHLWLNGFFDVFNRQNRRKMSRVDTKTPVFNKGMTYQRKETGLIKVSI
jgi:hypothetical protein